MKKIKGEIYVEFKHKNKTISLTSEIVIKIRKDLNNGLKNIDVAKKYKIDRRNVSKIKLNQRWKHI